VPLIDEVVQERFDEREVFDLAGGGNCGLVHGVCLFA
jgi:hypothetical protein